MPEREVIYDFDVDGQVYRVDVNGLRTPVSFSDFREAVTDTQAAFTRYAEAMRAHDEPVPEQRCTQCETSFPQTDENFRYLARQERWHPWCRPCERANNRIRGAARRAASRVRGAFRFGRRFGVEIEFFGVNRERAIEALNAAGVRTRTGQTSGWRMKTDGSVNGRGTGVGSGLELVSPPLTGEAGLRQAKLAFDTLKAIGARVDRSCGLHVHLDMNDLQASGIKMFARSWLNNQPLIQYLISQSRRDGHYCRKLTETKVRALENAGNDRFLPGARYSAVNVNSFPIHGTVEIRCHQGTLDYRKFESWLWMAQAMLAHIEREQAPVDAKSGLREFFTDLGLPQRTSDYLIRRARRFNAPEALIEAPVTEEVAA